MMEDLTKQDLLVLLEIIDDALRCDDLDTYKQIVLKLHLLVNFESAFCLTFGMVEFKDEKVNLPFTTINYPEEYLNRYISKGYHIVDPIGKEYLKTFDIQNWSDVMHKYKRKPETIVANEARDFGLYDGMTYGIPDLSSMSTTCFSFAGKVMENDDRTRFILKHSITHLSSAYLRLLAKVPKQNFVLTPMELEVLKWLKEGKSNWEISNILNKSERTIKFHVNNIIAKLGALNRTHAVVKALENKLISI
jgi:LuxR family transcriptional regulator, quorum-sensing system regulator CviR